MLVPKVIGNMVIEGGNNLPVDGEAIALASANWVGIGNKDHARNYVTNVQVFDPRSGTCLFEMKGLEQAEIEVGDIDKAGHTFTRVAWDADIDMLFKGSKPAAAQQWLASKNARELVDLVSHKTPGLTVLELNLDVQDESSIWQDEEGSVMRSACSQYSFAVCRSEERV